MEFKVILTVHSAFQMLVDIGTEWNLKCLLMACNPFLVSVDIGTEWNLKDGRTS